MASSRENTVSHVHGDTRGVEAGAGAERGAVAVLIGRTAGGGRSPDPRRSTSVRSEPGGRSSPPPPPPRPRRTPRGRPSTPLATPHRESTQLKSSHAHNSYALFLFKKKKK